MMTGGGSGEQERRVTKHAQVRKEELGQARRASSNAHTWAYYQAITYAHVQAYVSLAVKASGLLALSFCMVILLGGYVQLLKKQDFFCIMAISAIQSAGIFQDWETNLQYLDDFVEICFINTVWRILSTHSSGLLLVVGILLYPFIMILSLCAELLYLLGPLACAALSSWRIAKLNHGNYKDDGTDSFVDMMGTLNIFYSLIIFQGTMSLVLLLAMPIYRLIVASRIHSLEHLSEDWGEDAIRSYLSHMARKCRKDTLSIKGMDMIKYAAELLDSESQKDYLYGARLLSAFVSKGRDVSCVLLPSRHRIQRLIDSLMISSSRLDDKKEIRELAATIVADVAAHIDDLSNYPWAMRCISFLLQHQEETSMVIREHQHRHQKSEGGRGTSNNLVQQGLTILERLASISDDNRRIIYSAPGLLPKITAPLYSAILIEDIKTKAWADIVTRCLKVLYQLVRAPDGSHEIFSNVQALSNLKSILELGNNGTDHQELQLVAMDILTELALDLPINLDNETKKVLVTKQLQLFLLANGDDEESAAIAGRAMVSLSTNSEDNSNLIMTTENGIIGRLTKILNDENITRRTIAAEIMANLCAHCNVDNMKILLPKVLRKIMLIKTKSQERKNSVGQNNPALGDEENQGNSVSTNNEERHNISTRGNHTEAEETSHEEREEQEAFLSLAQVICDKLDSSDLDGEIQNAVQSENNAGSEEQRREAFVDKLKTIIEDNCHPAADSLRIVKVCGQIANSVMRCQQYVEIFRNRGFKSSLSEASKIMSELESYMHFVGTDFRLKKTVRPLFYEIEKTWSEM